MQGYEVCVCTCVCVSEVPIAKGNAHSVVGVGVVGRRNDRMNGWIGKQRETTTTKIILEKSLDGVSVIGGVERLVEIK